jgi:hypothetical protein
VVSLGLASAFALEAARAAGLSKDQLYRMVARGEVDRVGHGVYVRPDRLHPTVCGTCRGDCRQAGGDDVPH